MQPLIKKCSSLFNVYLVLVKQMLMLYQNALVLFGFLVIYYKTICCEVNLEGRGKEKKITFWLRGSERESGLTEKEQEAEGKTESATAPSMSSLTPG